jgi:hypothetical protein
MIKQETTGSRKWKPEPEPPGAAAQAAARRDISANNRTYQPTCMLVTR